ncbi:SGNH/GDSL hydrolase family protein [Amycolatopsis endophytica]|uniref:Lysophospholipase L1-like esterase n=1 Tax=Amycolatopsis endophytica TaxID=860233 RepID=A0A853AYP5_9PSEU|nr:SGNH/GDSL hydrolase family protein [Amycolatopsis endophytica]NYI87838.1 lysophospholipase L1-like esterase [Amycolatopsis endophytica]
MGKKVLIGVVVTALVGAATAGVVYWRGDRGESAAPPKPPGSVIGPGTGRYVALGDSYTSSPKTGARAGLPAGCARSDNNYPHLVAAKIRPASFADVSCGGATTEHLTEPQTTPDGVNPPQLDAVTPDTTLVTLGMGGNDIGLVGLARDCLTTNKAVSLCKPRLTAGGRDELATRIADTAPKIREALTAIHERAPRAQVVVVGYPTALPDGTGCWPFLPIGPDDVAYLRTSLAKLNTMLATEARQNSAGYADTATPSKGKDMCAKARVKWVEDVVPSSPAMELHPNAVGERGMADVVLDLVD